MGVYVFLCRPRSRCSVLSVSSVVSEFRWTMVYSGFHSMGQVAAALGTLGWPVLHDPAFWWCVAALPLTGLLNVGVSFLLALRVAVRARDVHVQDRARLRQAVWQRLRRHPLSFLLPPRG